MLRGGSVSHQSERICQRWPQVKWRSSEEEGKKGGRGGVRGGEVKRGTVKRHGQRQI